MRDNRCPGRERVRIDIKKSTLDDASRNAAENGESWLTDTSHPRESRDSQLQRLPVS
jgi:hypothetical protein